jgi:hypothetical protein
MAETKNDALLAFDAFVETWGIKYDKAVDCLIKDRDGPVPPSHAITWIPLSSVHVYPGRLARC